MKKIIFKYLLSFMLISILSLKKGIQFRRDTGERQKRDQIFFCRKFIC